MKFQLFVVTLLISAITWAKGLDGDNYFGSANIRMDTFKTDSSESSHTYNDVTLGYIRSKGFYYGVMYGGGNIKSDSETINFSHFGASIGYVLNGWCLMAHYLLGGTLKDASTKFKDGTGTQFDLGYLFKTGSSFLIGFQITQRDIKYKDSASNPFKMQEMYPMLKLAIAW